MSEDSSSLGLSSGFCCVGSRSGMPQAKLATSSSDVHPTFTAAPKESALPQNPGADCRRRGLGHMAFLNQAPWPGPGLPVHLW